MKDSEKERIFKVLDTLSVKIEQIEHNSLMFGNTIHEIEQEITSVKDALSEQPVKKCLGVAFSSSGQKLENPMTLRLSKETLLSLPEDEYGNVWATVFNRRDYMKQPFRRHKFIVFEEPIKNGD